MIKHAHKKNKQIKRQTKSRICGASVNFRPVFEILKHVLEILTRQMSPSLISEPCL